MTDQEFDQLPSRRVFEGSQRLLRRNSILYAILSLIVVGMTSLSAWALLDERRDLLEKAITRNSNAAEVSAEQLYRMLSVRGSTLGLIADQIATHSLTPTESLVFARSVVAHFSDLRPMLLINADGDFVWNTGAMSGAGRTYSDRDYFQAHRGGVEELIGQPLTGRITGTPFLPMTRRVTNARGEFTGVLFEGVEGETIEAILKEATLGAEGVTAALTFATGAKLFQHSNGAAVQQGSFDAQMVKEALDQPGEIIERRIQSPSGDVLVSLTALRRYPLMVAVSLEEKVLLAEWRRQVTFAILANLLVIGALTLLARRDAKLVDALYLSNQAHRRDAEALRRSEERVTLATKSAGIGFWELDLDTGALRWDAVQCQLFAVNATSFAGTRADWLARIEPMDLAAVEPVIANARLDIKPYTVEYRVRWPNGELRMLQSAGVFRTGPDGAVIQELGVSWDVTDLTDATRRLEEANQRLSAFAFYDMLTGLANRRLLLDRLEQALRVAKRQVRRVGVLFIDLNKFKELNDTHGHEAGDQLLAEVARRLQRSVREIDTVARLGGDEFIILLEELDANPVAAVAATEAVVAKINRALAQPYPLGSLEYVISASIGVKISDGLEEDSDQILRDADKAMYAAKQRRREQSESAAD